MAKHDPSPSLQDGSGFPIRVASRLTGIAADTLRIWERRYGFPKPVRDAAGVRVYTEQDLERLRLIARATKLGCRPGDAIRMDADDLTKLLTETSGLRPETTEELPHLDTLLDLLQNDDLTSLSQTLERLATSLGSEAFVIDVAAPLVDRVGARWQAAQLSVYQEHLFTQILSAQHRALLCSYSRNTGPSVLLATFPRERHFLGMEMVALFLAGRGARVHLLGPDIPPAQILAATKALSVRALCIGISAASPPGAAGEFLKELCQSMPDTVALWVGGQGAERLTNLPRPARLMLGWAELREAYLALGA